MLLACVRLGLFDKLAAGPQPVEEIAREAALPAESADILLRAAISLDLLEWRGKGQVGLGMLGAVMVDRVWMYGPRSDLLVSLMPHIHRS